MSDTYERNQKKGTKRERFEWIHSWCDNTQGTDKPRILLIGDSIVCGYQEKVRAALADVCYVDYFATSYAIDDPCYKKFVTGVASNADYALIFFNFGLHGGHIGARSYLSRYDKVFSALSAYAPVVGVTSTQVMKRGKATPDTVWKKKLVARNGAVAAVAEKYHRPVCDLFAVSAAMPYEMRVTDGYHFTDEGYNVLCDAVCKKVKELL